MCSSIIMEKLRFSGISSRWPDPSTARKGLELIATAEEIVPGTEDAMSWMVSDFGLLMTLSARSRTISAQELGGFLDRLRSHSDGRNNSQCRPRCRLASFHGGC